ncbi:P1 [Maize yellow dwarf virus RMV]|uniref:p1 n=1 Tax=Maize yellow dwarf virus RMV TaxID=2170101 RepID=R9U353_9VIRU|nr:P1 [Maize yellow dwarf virus RMV]AGN49060.1 P1 [Maize yellow dwarf virus RMV]
MLKLWCALLLLFCLSCSVNSHSLGSSLVRYTPPLRSMRYVPPAEYLLPWNSSSMVTRQNTCIEISYTALSREILQLAYRDLTRISSVAINASNSGWKVFAEELSSLVTHLHQNISRSFHGLRGLAVDGVQALAGGFLLAVIYTWSYLISLLFWVVTTLVCRYTFQMSSIACLYVCTMLLVRLASKIFGGWPVMIISLIGTLTSKLFRALSFKKSSISFEIPTPGYKTVEIPQKPPKDCVLLVQHNDALNSPGGYASCVRLLNGSNALLTAKHVSTQEGDLLIASSRTGNRIKLSLFNTILTTKNSDVGLYQGPPGWESILGCKAADIVPVDGLSCCEASIYRHDGNWMRSNASLVGTEGTFVSVLSNTIEGFSGTPYFNGKSILGVHVGGNETRTNNLMAPIPSIPGLTKHKYVFESPQLRGRLFTDEEVEKLEFEIDEAFQKAHNLIHFKSKTGRNWADDEDDIHFEAPKFQGNDARGPVRENKTVSPTPTHSPVVTSGNDTLNKVVEALVSKIDVSVIERMVVQKISESALKRPTNNNRKHRRKPKTSQPTLPPSTDGRYVAPARRSPASKPADPSPNTTSQNKKKNQSGGGYLQRETRRWQVKSAASGGPNSDPRPN